MGVFLFLERHFCYAKVVACGRVIEREWGNPSKVPPSHSPFLAVYGGRRQQTPAGSHETPFGRMGFFYIARTARLDRGNKLCYDTIERAVRASGAAERRLSARQPVSFL